MEAEERDYIYSADELYRYTSDILGEDTLSPEEYVEDWLRWFRKRG